MTIVGFAPLLIAIIGLLIYLLASGPKVVEVGRTLFWSGTLVTLMGAAHTTFKLGG